MNPRRILIFVLAALIPPFVVGSLSAVKISSDIMLHKTPEPIEIPAALSAPRSDPKKPTVLILAGTQGTQVLELLGAYGLISQSGKFNTFIVSPTMTLLPTTGAIAVYPHLTLEEAPTADVLIIPSLLDPLDPKTRGTIRGMISQAKWVLTLGEGARIPAELGDLTEATSHILSLDAFARAFPQVKWERQKAVVKSGKFISTGGGFAALEGTLDLIDIYAPDSTPANWLRSLQTSQTPERRTLSFAQTFQLLIRAAFDWLRQDSSIWITPGVDELSLALLLDLPPRTFHERVITVSDQRTVIPTRNGAWIVPLVAASAAPVLNQLIEAPGSSPSQSSLTKTWVDAHPSTSIYRWGTYSSDTLFSQLINFIGETSGLDSINTLLTQTEYPGAKPGASFLTLHLAELLLRAILLGLAGVLLVRWYLQRRTDRH